MYTVLGEDLRRNGTRLIGLGAQHPYPSTLRPIRGGHVHAHSNNRHPDLLAYLIEAPRILEPRILAAPSGHADEIDPLIDAWLADKDKFEAVRAAQEVRVPFTEVMAPDEVLAEPHYRERGFWATVRHPEAGALTYLQSPARLHGRLG
ncbi:MAG: CoA transferase [Dehalococcoidia bacterium]